MEKKIVWCPVCHKSGKCSDHKVIFMHTIRYDSIAEKMLVAGFQPDKSLDIVKKIG